MLNIHGLRPETSAFSNANDVSWNKHCRSKDTHGHHFAFLFETIVTKKEILMKRHLFYSN